MGPRARCCYNINARVSNMVLDLSVLERWGMSWSCGELRAGRSWGLAWPFVCLFYFVSLVILFVFGLLFSSILFAFCDYFGVWTCMRMCTDVYVTS